MKQILLSIIFIAGAVGVFFGWTQGTLDQIAAINDDKKSLEDVLSRFYELRKTKNDLTEKYNSIRAEDINRLEEIIPYSANEGELIVEFENLTRDHGLLLKQINISPEQEKKSSVLVLEEERYKDVPITLTIDGSYFSFKEFLASVEKSLRIIDIESISFNAGGLDSYEFVISAKAYFKKQE